MTTNPTRTETEQGKKGRRSRPVTLGKINLLLALLGLLLLIGAYRLTLLPETLALLILTVSLVTVLSRAWHARRKGLEYGLLRHPFSRELRPYLLQCLNHWLFWALFGAALLAGTFATVPAGVALVLSLPLPDRIPYQPLVISLGAAALVMAALALIPRRQVQIATNVLVAIGTVFLAIQLVRIYSPPADPVAIDPPLAGEWAMLAGGRSALISHHYRTPIVSNAVDFVQLDEEGRGHDGDPKRETSWYGFGEPVLSPADGAVVSVTDVHPDEPVGNIGQNPSTGNHILIDIGSGRYAVLAHLQQGSARVSKGERVRLGQQIAAVGDSGDSLVPHLHFQVQDSPDFGAQVRTLPIVFRNVVLIRGGRESTPAEADLRRGDHVRRIGN
ncbi:MAG TPA: M23 family metallopeptidase [Propionibacteriaceae bacterium]|nr:M23 family metallopeptidase [Propionibacteriaceae bacterium]